VVAAELLDGGVDRFRRLAWIETLQGGPQAWQQDHLAAIPAAEAAASGEKVSFNPQAICQPS
jgi:hypothetical protein